MLPELPSLETLTALPEAPAMPPIYWVLMGIALLIGLILWAFGRALARPACVATGLIAGVGVGWGLRSVISSTDMQLMALIIAALVGGLMAWLFFRIWMGALLAGLLMAALPIVSIVTYDQPMPLGRDAAGEVFAGPMEEEPPRTEDAAPPESESLAPEATVPPESEASAKESITADLTRLASGIRDSAVNWWHDLDTLTHRLLILTALIGGIVGLGVGLATPDFAAAMATASVGAALLLTGSLELTEVLVTNGKPLIPPRPSLLLAITGVLAAIGVGLQMASHRRAKE